MKRCASLELGNGRDKERERVVERKVNSREKKDGKNQQRRIVSEGETRENGGERKEKKKEAEKKEERGWCGSSIAGRNIVRDSKVDERVGSHVDVKDRNCEFVDPRVE